MACCAYRQMFGVKASEQKGEGERVVSLLGVDQGPELWLGSWFYSVGFPVAVHVAGAGLGNLSAVETVQKTPGDLRDHGPVRDRLRHAVDGSHSCSFLIGILHYNGDRVPNVFNKEVSDSWLSVQDGATDVDA